MLSLPLHSSCVARAQCFHDSASSGTPSQGVQVMDGNACWVYPILSILQVGPNIMVIENAGGHKGKSFSRSLSLEEAPQA